MESEIFETSSVVDPLLKPIIVNPEYKELSSGYFLYPEVIRTNSILFIGINPSSHKDQEVYATYNLEKNKTEYPYFKRMQEIADKCNIGWTHLDLLFFRQTNQKKIQTEILKNKFGASYINDQLKISDKLIRLAKAKVIVVSNALACNLLGKVRQNDKQKWLNYSFEFNDDIGTYVWEKTPVFFSGMLSGQRALDIGSYERLIWQIKRTLKLLDEEKSGSV